MPIQVLVVDDSSFFRRRVSEIIERDPTLSVVGTAKDGKDAIEQAIALKPDVITMDVEMPVMDGITAVKEIMAQSPTAILMFSSLTHDGAQATLDALDAGALDFLPKKFEDIARNRDDAVELLQSRIKHLGKKASRMRRFSSAPSRVSRAVSSTRKVGEPSAEQPKPAPVTKKVSAPVRGSSSRVVGGVPNTGSVKRSPDYYKLMTIGTSTGGPVALQRILTQLPASFPVPILLVQHMPAAFTPAFASRLNTLCKISVKEAESGDVLKPGWAYLAPGGCQMMVEGRAPSLKLKVVKDNSERLTYKPSVDLTFGSVAKSYGGSVLGIILTGMGADGRDGSRMLKSAGATIWAQDEASCVVYGMPQAVASAGVSDESIALNDFAQRINTELGVG